MPAELKIHTVTIWRDVVQPFVKVSGTWRALSTVEVKHSGTWREVWPGTLIVSANGFLARNIRFNNICYGGVSFNSSGTEFERQTTSPAYTGTNRGVWLDSGSAGAVWVQRIMNSGTLDDDPGTGRLNCATTRNFGIEQAPIGVKTVNITFNFYDAASGGSLLDTVTHDISAENTL